MQELINGLEKQLSMYEKILEKTTKGKEAFANKDNDLFMSALAARLKMMKDINFLERELKPLRQQWIDKKSDFSDIFNKKVFKLVREIKELMDKILEIENSIMEVKIKEQQEVTDIPRAKAISRYQKM